MSFFTQAILICHKSKNTGVTNNINDQDPAAEAAEQFQPSFILLTTPVLSYMSKYLPEKRSIENVLFVCAKTIQNFLSRQSWQSSKGI